MEDDTLIFWDWPAKRQPFRSFFAVGIVVFGIAVASNAHWLLGIAAAILLISSLGEVLLPTRYHLDSHGISMMGIHTLSHQKWADIESLKSLESGILLIGQERRRYAFKRNKWLIRCLKNQETVLDIINKQCLGKQK